MSENEFSRLIKLRQVSDAPIVLEPNKVEMAAIAGRFSLSALHRLKAEITLIANGSEVTATGRLLADFLQPCAISGEDFPVHVDEDLAFRFVPESQAPKDEELELGAEDCDVIFYPGDGFDLGDAVVESLGLAIDPYATGPNADVVREDVGLLDKAAAGPFAALAALKTSKPK